MNFGANIKQHQKLLAALLAAIAIFAAGIYVGYTNQPSVQKIATVLNKQTNISEEKSVNFEPFWRSWRAIEEKYVGTDGLDRQKMVWGAISGMTSALGDPYTVFFPPEEKKLFESEVRGDFEGVGMEIAVKKGILTVVAPLKGTP